MDSTDLREAIDLRLALFGQPLPSHESTLVAPVLARINELYRRLPGHRSPADQRIQDFLDDYLAGSGTAPQLPDRTLVLDEPGLARELALPLDRDEFSSPLLASYRLINGVLHNPANDRRTTAGVFHVAEGGLPIPDDKRAVPREVFGRLLERAFDAPPDWLVLPYASQTGRPVSCFASLLLRPLVCPGVPGYTTERRMEIRFIVPGGLVANLDFVESIFGNAGDPFLPENDAALDPEGWTGHTGAVILAPHLTSLTKRELGLPHHDEATERQRRDRMCWTDPEEKYNDGQAFKACARDARGVIVTVIADNYFGYCKKEVKTQISYSANLFGNVEEEHAGGALVFPSYALGQEVTLDVVDGYTLAEVLERDPERYELQPDGHALVVGQPHLALVPEKTTFSLRTQTVTWQAPDGGVAEIPMRADTYYIGPTGYVVEMAHIDTDVWTLVGTRGEPTHCHKPATVSGGGKSEISKPITYAIIHTNTYTADFDTDMQAVADILATDFSGRWADPDRRGSDSRTVLSDRRTLGSVIKLLTPSSDYSSEYNDWLESIPQHIKELVFVVKRAYRPEWGANWRNHFTVGIMNGRTGNALRLDGAKVLVGALRVGFDEEGSWRIFSLRHDFHPSAKVQTEDDITASVVAPPGTAGTTSPFSRKFVVNCEQQLFQRPDDAIHRGYDHQAEADIAKPGTFLSNFEPLTRTDAIEIRDRAIEYSEFTAPQQDLIAQAAEPGADPGYFVCSAYPRIVDGKPSKNPRYLQVRPDLADPRHAEMADFITHLARRLPLSMKAPSAVHVVAAGRRNNPPDDGVPPLCCYSPLHFMQLPELFMEFISSMTGKSPSTTGAGSEGAMTKGPFNAMPAVIDLNAALVGFILTGYDGWVSSAGYIGPRIRVDHDVSLLVPEMFSRMTPAERDSATLIEQGRLEKIEDFEFEGRHIPASRLGYRITERFTTEFLGRIFLHPNVVFTEDMLRPEVQDLAIFAESVEVIIETHRRVAQAYFDDGTADLACPPLRALLEIMAFGEAADGHGLDDEEVRSLFGRDAMLASEWYAARLDSKQAEDARRAQASTDRLSEFVGKEHNAEAVERLGLDERLASARERSERFRSEGYRSDLVGTIGRQPL